VGVSRGEKRVGAKVGELATGLVLLSMRRRSTVIWEHAEMERGSGGWVLVELGGSGASLRAGTGFGRKPLAGSHWIGVVWLGSHL
jgi:hypothetical protein